VSPTTATWKEKVYHQLHEFLVIAFYLWLVLVAFAVYKSIVLGERHVSVAACGIALLNALALAKVMLFAEDLHVADRFKDEPLVYPTLFKSVAFAILLGCFKILEEAVVGWRHGYSFNESIVGVGGGTLRGILALTAILAVVLVPLVAFTELRGVLGGDTLVRIFFTSRNSARVSP
jgi:hypothetical protein